MPLRNLFLVGLLPLLISNASASNAKCTGHVGEVASAVCELPEAQQYCSSKFPIHRSTVTAPCTTTRTTIVTSTTTETAPAYTLTQTVGTDTMTSFTATQTDTVTAPAVTITDTATATSTITATGADIIIDSTVTIPATITDTGLPDTITTTVTVPATATMTDSVTAIITTVTTETLTNTVTVTINLKKRSMPSGSALLVERDGLRKLKRTPKSSSTTKDQCTTTKQAIWNSYKTAAPTFVSSVCACIESHPPIVTVTPKASTKTVTKTATTHVTPTVTTTVTATTIDDTSSIVTVTVTPTSTTTTTATDDVTVTVTPSTTVIISVTSTATSNTTPTVTATIITTNTVTVPLTVTATSTDTVTAVTTTYATATATGCPAGGCLAGFEGNNFQTVTLCNEIVVAGQTNQVQSGISSDVACLQGCLNNEFCTVFTWDYTTSVCVFGVTTFYINNPTTAPAPDTFSGYLSGFC